MWIGRIAACFAEHSRIITSIAGNIASYSKIIANIAGNIARHSKNIANIAQAFCFLRSFPTLVPDLIGDPGDL